MNTTETVFKHSFKTSKAYRLFNRIHGIMELSKKFLIVSVISSSLLIIVVLSQNSIGPNYDLEIQKVVLLNQSDYISFQNLRVKRYNKTVHAVNGGINFNIDFGEGWDVVMHCWRSKLGNNQWELTALKAPRQNVCDFVKTVYKDQIQTEFHDSSDLPVFMDGDSTCPFPKGNYTLTNYMADVRNFPTSLQDGTYRIEIFFFNEDIVKTGFIIYVKIYPEVG